VRTPPQLRGGLPLRLALLVLGLLLFASGIVALLESRLGLSPWDVLHQGLARHTPLSFGEANIAVGSGVLAVAFVLGARMGIGTIANAVLVGLFLQLLISLHSVSSLAQDSVAIRVVVLAAGLALMGSGTALYISAGLGAGPRDSLMVVGAQRTRFRIGAVRATLELTALAAGFALGGTIGVGTVAFAVVIGPLVELGFALLERSPLAASRRHHRDGSSNWPMRRRLRGCEEAL
jgi:uncharacterized protein